MAIKGVGSLSMTEINSEFAYGNNLGAYNGKQWYKFDGTIGNFSLPIKYSDFYGKQKSPAYTYADIKTSSDVTVARSQNIALLLIGGGGRGGTTKGSSASLEGGGGGGAGGFYFTDFTVPVQAGGILRCTIGAGDTWVDPFSVRNALALQKIYTVPETFGRGGDTTVQHIVNGAVQWTYTAKGGGKGADSAYQTKGLLNEYWWGRSGGSSGGNHPYFGQTYYYPDPLPLSPLQGNRGAFGQENVTGGGGGGAAAAGYNGGGIRNGEGGSVTPQSAGGGNGGDGIQFELYGWSTPVGGICGGGASSGGASGGQWRTYGAGGRNRAGRIGGWVAGNFGSISGDTYLWPTGFAVGAVAGEANTGDGGGGTWALGAEVTANGGSGRVVIWYNP